MSSEDIAIRVSNLSKRYEIYGAPRDRLKQFVLPYLRQIMGKLPKQYFDEFWALRDVSFEIKKGETVGIIGHNGSGKSTLLQMICGTLTPTSGSIQTSGRIAALLELGSGFNPEFTGRENVYLNASVFGLSNAEIDARFDDIVKFADIGQFIEQPVKTYSSGMYVRLAFAVVAHVDADILAIDEALAVGDAVFTQKCMRFLRLFQKKGSLIFVSHDMGAVLNLCDRAVWLEHGQLRQIGDSKDISESYLQYTLQEVYGSETKLEPFDTSKVTAAINCAPKPIFSFKTDDPSVIEYGMQLCVNENLNEASGWLTGAGEIQSVHLDHLIPQPNQYVFRGGETVRMLITAKAHQKMDHPILGFVFRDRLGQDLFGENTLSFTNLNPLTVSAGATLSGEFVFRLPMLPNGEYSVVASLGDGDLNSNVQHHWLHDALIVNVSSSKVRWGLVGVHFEKVEMKEIS
jgi:lipopolysaccharide transport system ATP-binding protein